MPDAVVIKNLDLEAGNEDSGVFLFEESDMSPSMSHTSPSEQSEKTTEKVESVPVEDQEQAGGIQTMNSEYLND